MNRELWEACAGPLVNLPAAGTHVVYFPQGHSQQVAASMKKDVDAQTPNHPNLPSKLLCLLHNISLHADPETDEVYAQMTLQPVPSFDKDALLRSDLAMRSNKPQTEFFCKTLTASDTSTHGGFSVPRRAAEEIFPPLDFSMEPPTQELVARDLHDNVWNFRHIYRGQPKRHLLTTGWSLFVSGKRLFAGDSVLFVRDEKKQLLLGIRRTKRQPTNLSSSVLSSDSMHIGILAAADHAAANNSPFTVFYNPRTRLSEFVIPLAKYYKAVYGHQISLGMRFRMMFENDSGTRKYMGTVTGISDLDPVRWKNSQWKNLQVGWDESTAEERRDRVSMWEIEPITAPFFIYPPPFFLSKYPRQLGMLDCDSADIDNLFKRIVPWLGDDLYMKDPQALTGLSLVQWMNMQQNPSFSSTMLPNYVQSLSSSVLQNLAGADLSRQFGLSSALTPQPNCLQFNSQRVPQQAQQIDSLPKLPSSMNPLSSIIQTPQKLSDIAPQSRQNLINQTLPSNQVQSQIPQPQTQVQTINIIQQRPSSQSHLPRNFHQSLQQQQHQNQEQHVIGQNQQPSLMQTHLPDQVNPHLQMSDNQIQLQLLQKLQWQQQSLLAQQSVLQQPGQLSQFQDRKRQHLDASSNFSTSVAPRQILDMSQTTPTSLPPPNTVQQHIKHIGRENARFPCPPQQSKSQLQQSGILSETPGHTGFASNSTTNQPCRAGSGILTMADGAGQSGITEDVPSCSTSPSTNNCQNLEPVTNNGAHQSTPLVEDMAQSTATLLSPYTLETMSSNVNLVKDLYHGSDVKPSLNISKNHNDGIFTPQAYKNSAAVQADYLDTSPSFCLYQNDVKLYQSNNSLSYDPPPVLLRDASRGGELQKNPSNNVPPYGANIDSHLSIPMNSDNMLTKDMVGMGNDFSNNLSSGCMPSNCENSKDPQPELSSLMVPKSFGVPDMAFNSIDSTINNNGFLNSGPWDPPTQFQRMRTYAKVYKRGAVGRSVDITRYSGYEELKQDLARRFGIEGQLEDQGRIGWKLVYVDHENDVLLVGDDPWEEFVNCVRCIKILSPQEVQQMSLDVDFGNSVLPNQAYSSADDGKCIK